jgi:hypothetical protein
MPPSTTAATRWMFPSKSGERGTRRLPPTLLDRAPKAGQDKTELTHCKDGPVPSVREFRLMSFNGKTGRRLLDY